MKRLCMLLRHPVALALALLLTTGFFVLIGSAHAASVLPLLGGVIAISGTHRCRRTTTHDKSDQSGPQARTVR